MEGVSESGHCLYTLLRSTAARARAYSGVLQALQLKLIQIRRQSYPRMIDARDPSEPFLPSLVSSSVLHLRSPRVSHNRCCPGTSSRPLPGQQLVVVFRFLRPTSPEFIQSVFTGQPMRCLSA